VRWARFRRWNLILTFGLIVLLAAWLFGPQIGLTVPFAVFALGALLVVLLNIMLIVWTYRAMRADTARVLAAHPDSTAFPTGIVAWPDGDRAARESVVAVVADRNGLSFRDHEDREALLLPADRIMSLELAPLERRARFRPLRVTSIDGGTFDFLGPATPDAQVDAVVALREALGRKAG
jgi:hypothetical protein